jgi:hypothetical protein
MSKISKTTVKIEDWLVVEDLASESYRELQPGMHLMGYAFGHASHPNAKFIYTSSIVSVDTNSGLVETLNTTYQLGEANPGYKNWDWKRKASAA